MSPPSGSSGFAIEALFPNFHNERWVSYTLKSILEGLHGEGISIGATVLSKGPDVRAPYVHPLTHRRLQRFIFPRLLNPVSSVFRSARRRLGPGDVAYFWLQSPASLCDYFRARRVMVVREMINCTLRLRRTELTKAYVAMGMPDLSGITDEMIERERRDLLAADAIFCPNPFVRGSLMDYGVPQSRCLETSYGWNADRLAKSGDRIPPTGQFTVAFVGTINVRKGAPVLLEAWVRSGIDGRLLLAGATQPEIERRYVEVLRREDVVRLGYVADIGSVYRAADVFCFPSWEEGGPQVTIEAMSAGAVPVVTPMGTAGVFAAGEDAGIVIPPGDVEALSGALRDLARDRGRLLHMKEQAKKRAAEFTWEKVAHRRRGQLVAAREAWLA